jgi:hypothetical protein
VEPHAQDENFAGQLRGVGSIPESFAVDHLRLQLSEQMGLRQTSIEGDKPRATPGLEGLRSKHLSYAGPEPDLLVTTPHV